jgi:signal transduction histidine kinase
MPIVNRYLDTIKGRLIVGVATLLVGAHVIGLWLYATRSRSAIALLHDTLIAERISTLVRTAEFISADERARFLALLDAEPITSRQPSFPSTEKDRADLTRHLIGAILGRPNDEGITVAYSLSAGGGVEDRTSLMVNAAAHMDEHHRAFTPIAEIERIGTIVSTVTLMDGTKAKFTVPALGAKSFSFFNLSAALAAMIASSAIIAAWALRHWTQPLVNFARAAERLGTDINAPTLPESGIYEVRIAAVAFNQMQERVRRLLEDRSAMAGAIAHDLGTPVTRLRLRAEEIIDDELRAQMLDDIEQMRRMMADTLEFSRSTSALGRVEQFDLRSLTQAVCDDLIDLGASIAFDADAIVPIHSDPVNLRRALSNLIENASKYGSNVFVRIVSADGHVSINIEDNGPGIPPELHEAVFRPFFRMPNDNTSNSSGTGLGMTIARSTIVRLGGTVKLFNLKPHGLRVIVSLPMCGQVNDADRI